MGNALKILRVSPPSDVTVPHSACEGRRSIVCPSPFFDVTLPHSACEGRRSSLCASSPHDVTLSRSPCKSHPSIVCAWRRSVVALTPSILTCGTLSIIVCSSLGATTKHSDVRKEPMWVVTTGLSSKRSYSANHDATTKPRRNRRETSCVLSTKR